MRESLPGKGRYDLLPWHAIDALAKVMEQGSIKYAPRNWELGLPLSSFLDSGLRHVFKLLGGQTDEDHASLALWNMACFVHTRRQIELGLLPAELDDLPASVSARLNGASMPATFRRVSGTRHCDNVQSHDEHSYEFDDKLWRCAGVVPKVPSRGDEDDPNWISFNRCGLRSDHPAHGYQDNSQWCDGYVTDPDRRKLAADVRAVERVADSQSERR
jgi:hypothetical protein